MKQALCEVWGHKWIWVQVAALAAGMDGLSAWWFSLPVARAWDLALHGLVLLMILALLVLAGVQVWRTFLVGAPPWSVMVRSARNWLAAGIAVMSGVVAPAALVWWVPGFETLEAQAASAVVRFVVAGALATGSVLWLAACVGRVDLKEG